MLKLLWRLCQLTAAAFLISVMSIWTTSYIVTHYVEKILAEYELALEVGPPTLPEMWGALWGKSIAVSTESQAKQVLPAFSDTVKAVDEKESDIVDESSIPADPHEPNATNATDTSDSAYSEQEEVGADGGLEAYEQPEAAVAEVFSNIDTEMLEAMSSQDRGQLFDLLSQKLPQKAWRQLADLASGEVSDEQIIELQGLLAEYLAPVEYESLMNILKKY